MKRNYLGEDNIVCPECNECGMVEYEDDIIVVRKCLICDYIYEFEKREMRNIK